jgi:hypothetical protein
MYLDILWAWNKRAFHVLRRSEGILVHRSGKNWHFEEIPKISVLLLNNINAYITDNVKMCFCLVFIPKISYYQGILEIVIRLDKYLSIYIHTYQRDICPSIRPYIGRIFFLRWSVDTVPRCFCYMQVAIRIRILHIEALPLCIISPPYHHNN